MSDINGKTEEKKGFWASLFGSIDKIDEALHEKPISRIEDIFALIGLGTVANRAQTFFGAFLLILSFILRGGMEAWGWSEAQRAKVRAMLNSWVPFSPHGNNDTMVVMAFRRLFDLHHLYRWLIVLGGMGVLLSLSIWLITVASWIGYVMFVAVLVGLFAWSVMSRTSHILVVPIVGLLVIGAVVLGLTYITNAQTWMMIFAIMTVIASMAMLGVVFWPISVIARLFSAKEQVEQSAGSDAETVIPNPKKKAKEQISVGKFIANYIVALCWPVSLMVSALMFTVWADIQSQVAYMTIMVILLSLGLFGIRKEGIRKVLNTAAVSNLFIYLAIVGFHWMVPADMQASVVYQTKDYVYDAIGVYSFRTDATYYWDVNNNSRPDTTDLRFLQDGLTDSLVFPQADRRFADVNGDGQSTDADLVYFKRFMDDKGPRPVKAGWLGTPKPGAHSSASISSTSQPDSSQLASAGGGGVSDPGKVRTITAGVTSTRAAAFFDLTFDSVTVDPNQTIAYVTWTNPRSNDENASLSSATLLRDNLRNAYRLSTASGVNLDGKVKLTAGQRISAVLEFPPLKPGVTFVMLEVQDLWQNGPFTLACNL